MELNKLAKEIYENNKTKGFWEGREMIPLSMESTCNDYGDKIFDISEVKDVKKAFIGQQLMLIVSEISEAMEADRKDLMDDKLTNRTGLEVELADALIRILDMSGGLGLDIEGAMYEKLEYNKSRPFKHGKNY